MALHLFYSITCKLEKLLKIRISSNANSYFSRMNGSRTADERRSDDNVSIFSLIGLPTISERKNCWGPLLGWRSLGYKTWIFCLPFNLRCNWIKPCTFTLECLISCWLLKIHTLTSMFLFGLCRTFVFDACFTVFSLNIYVAVTPVNN